MANRNRFISRDQVIVALRLRQASREQAALALDIGISEQLLSNVFSGIRRPGVKILEFLGLVKVEAYEKAHRTAAKG